MNVLKRTLFLLVLLAGGLACGQKGDLYMPEDQTRPDLDMAGSSVSTASEKVLVVRDKPKLQTNEKR